MYGVHFVFARLEQLCNLVLLYSLWKSAQVLEAWRKGSSRDSMCPKGLCDSISLEIAIDNLTARALKYQLRNEHCVRKRCLIRMLTNLQQAIEGLQVFLFKRELLSWF